MPIGFMLVIPKMECSLPIYKEYICVYNVNDAAIINRFTLENNAEDSSIEEVHLYIPFPEESMEELWANTESYNKERAFNNYSKIKLDIGPGKIKPDGSFQLDIIYNLKNITTKFNNKRILPIHYYNLNPYKQYIPELPTDGIPRISKDGFELCVAIPNYLIFDANVQGEAEVCSLAEHDELRSCLRNLCDGKAQSKLLSKCFTPSLDKGYVASWSKAQLSDLPNMFSTAFDARLIRAGYSIRDYIIFRNIRITYSDIYILFISIAFSILLSIVFRNI